MKTKIIYRIITGLFVASALFGLNSCTDDGWDFSKISDEILLTPELAAPIAYGNLSLLDLLNEVDTGDYVKEFDDSLLYIAYAEDLFSYPVQDVMIIPDQNFLELFIEAEVGIIPFWSLNPVGDTVSFDKSQDGEFNFENSERMDSVYIKTMDLEINVSSTFKHKGFIILGSDSIVLDNIAYEEFIPITTDDGSFDTTITVSMNGYKIYFDNTVPDKTYLPLNFELSLINSGNSVVAGENCNITLNFKNVEFSSTYGYFGNYDLIVESGEVLIELFDTEDLFGGSISFFDPQFSLNVSNSYGVPVQIELTDFSAYSKINDVTTPIVFNGINPFDIFAPGIDSVGTTVETVIEINNTNSDIADVINNTSPKKFNYTVSAITNPSGPEETDNFVTDSSSLEVGFEIILPMHFKADGFILEDTIDFDFEDQFGDAVEVIDYFNLIMDVQNGLPLEVNMQLIFKDSIYATLDSMFVDDQFLLPPTLDMNDNVSEPAEYTKTVEFDSDKLERIKTAKYMFLRATVSTADILDGKYVKVFSYYDIGFKLKMDAGFIINSRDL